MCGHSARRVPGHGIEPDQAWSAGLRRHRPRRLPERPDGRSVGARTRRCSKCCCSAAGRLVSKDQLVERLCEWGDEVSNNAIEVYIHRLRKKIEQGPVRHRHRARPRATAWKRSTPERCRVQCPGDSTAQRTTSSLFGEILDWMLAPLLLHLADEPGADLAGGPGHLQPALRPRARDELTRALSRQDVAAESRAWAMSCATG